MTGRSAQPLGVAAGDPRARREQLVQPPQLRQPDGAEDVRQPVVEPRRGHVGVGERAPAVVAQPRDRVGDALVVGRDRAALAGRDDLARVEAEAADEAERRRRRGRPAARRARPPRPRCTGRSGSSSIRAGRPNRCTARIAFVRGPTSTLRRIDVHRLRVDVDEHRPQAGERDDVRRRRERVRGDEHLVARLQPEREHRDVQRRRARRDRERVLGLAGPRELVLELRDDRAHREHAALEHVADRVELRRRRRRAGLGGCRLLRPVPRDRPGEAVVELDLRPPAEQLAGLVDVGDAQLDVGLVERRKTISPVAAGEAVDPLARS